jgi:hypothetical protein
MWQTLETKARFIHQVMTGESAVRRAEDVAGQELSYAEVKAIASGNPAVLTLAEADAELQRLAILKKNHVDEEYLARRKVRELPQEIAKLGERIAGLRADAATLAAHQGDRVQIGERRCSHEEVMAALSAALNRTPDRVDRTIRVLLGVFHGLPFGFERQPAGYAGVYLDGQVPRFELLSRDSQGPRAVLNALHRLAGSYDEQVAKFSRDQSVAEKQLDDYRDRQGKAFPHAEYLERLTALRNDLRVALTDKSPASAEEPGPTPTELAAAITTLVSSQKTNSAGGHSVPGRNEVERTSAPSSRPSVEPEEWGVEDRPPESAASRHRDGVGSMIDSHPDRRARIDPRPVPSALTR